jgi:hypothetical protein
MKTIPYNKFKHDQRVTCEINGVKIDDAKISIDNDGMIYICQNYVDGGTTINKLGYKFTYYTSISEESDDLDDRVYRIKNIHFLPRTLDDLEEGDVLVDVAGDGYEKTVLGVCGKVFFLSQTFSHESFDTGYTVEDLKIYGWTIKQEQQEEEITELTLEDVAKLANVPVEKLRIKD